MGRQILLTIKNKVKILINGYANSVTAVYGKGGKKIIINR